MNENQKPAVVTAEKIEKSAVIKKTAAKVEKRLTMPQVKSLIRQCGCTFSKCKNTATSYIILDGKSSINMKKNSYRLYATKADFELIKNLQLSSTQLIENGNAVDHCRPHTVNIGNNANLKMILTAIAVNNHVELK